MDFAALSPLDGRYAAQVDALRPHFSEDALLRARTEVEIRYFIALSREPAIREFPKMKLAQEKALMAIIDRFGPKDVREIKQIEKTTKHDVKAVEYYLQQRIARIPGLKDRVSFIHFGLTSEDVNNLAYGLLVHRALAGVIRPAVRACIGDLERMAKRWKNIRLLSLTHGQPATPSTLGKEMQVFADRLSRQSAQLKAFRMQGKFGGAVGNYAAVSVAYPAVRWPQFGAKFIRSLGLTPLANTTQINPHDDLAELSHLLVRINTILLDYSRDVWFYVSRGVFKQRTVAGEVGSSTMPHKVNPIDFENAEGNLGVSSALFSHFAEKLPISRLQRDLSDSTVQRNVGVAFGYHLLALMSLAKGMGKLDIDRVKIRSELNEHPEVIAEAIQIVLRKRGVTDAYERLKKLTRGRKVTTAEFRTFIAGLPISKSERDSLLQAL
jgi:adenylosuccinate lyase